MSTQLDLFSQTQLPNPLKGKRICLTGEFQMPQKELYAKLNAVGVETIDRVSETRTYKEGDAIPPVKETTNFFVVGSNPNEDSMKRYSLNQHDGFHAKMIYEQKLYDYLNGIFSDEDIVPNEVEKKINIDYNYYIWNAPVINGKTFVSRVSSPLSYDYEGKENPISQKEIFVEKISGVDMGVFSQIIGNLGGYANLEYYDDTNIVLLSDKTLYNLKNGIKDGAILDIENRYNNGNSKSFNIQFSCESDFIKWVEKRMESLPDESTIKLLNIYLSSKKEYG